MDKQGSIPVEAATLVIYLLSIYWTSKEEEVNHHLPGSLIPTPCGLETDREASPLK